VVRLRKKLLVTATIVVIALSFIAYAWVTRYGEVQADKNQETPVDVTKFKTVVNGLSSVDIFVCVNVADGLTEKEAELIVGTTFIQIMGDYVTHRLDTLDFDDAQITAHYTWGQDENDLGHVFGATADLTELQITVAHCF